MDANGVTLAEAAQLAGVSKSTLQRSVKAGRVSATRDDAGQWRIDPAELARVWPAAAVALVRRDAVDDAPDDAAVTRSDVPDDAMRRGEPVQLDIEIEALRAQLGDAREQIGWLREQLADASREKAQILALLPKPEAVPEPRPSWYGVLYDRLFGRHSDG
ncbi:MAG: helix-turn-helix domain-containing protein [Geminicoccaceae bacterium]|nr:helix-turn-helix domain-containing protein [Geminicoccaceae bacterium]